MAATERVTFIHPAHADERFDHVYNAFDQHYPSCNRLSAAAAGIGLHSHFKINPMATRGCRDISVAGQAFAARDRLAGGRRAALDCGAGQ